MKFEKDKELPRQSELENVLLVVRNKEKGRIDLMNSLSIVLVSPDYIEIKSDVFVVPSAKEILLTHSSKTLEKLGLMLSGLQVIVEKDEDVFSIALVNMTGRQIRVPKHTVLAHITDLVSKPEKVKKEEAEKPEDK